MESGDKLKLYQFTKSLAVKVAQIVVQSRKGKKVTQETNAVNAAERGLSSSSSNVQWFSLSIPDEPEVNHETIGVLNGGVVDALTKVLCIEISLRTNDGDGMVLELWTMRIIPGNEGSANSISTIYYRMSILLKTTLTITRMTPAYKMSRAQHKESYKIYHKIYSGEANFKLLGDGYKTIKVGELHTHVGTILIQVMHRTKMTILPEDKIKPVDLGVSPSVSNIMVKSDHFYSESPKRQTDKKEIDLSKPLTAGAFVDEVKIRELHDALSQQLPPEPPMAWLLAETEKVETKIKDLTINEKEDTPQPGCSAEPSTSSAPHAMSKAIEVPRPKNGDKYSSLMEFPFADGSPMAELANFYQECVQARSASDEWTEVVAEVSGSTDSDSLSQQLKIFEDAVPEFDSMVASMFSTSENSSDN